jgi:hypothetical protein
MPYVHVRLISPTCVPSDPTLNIWWSDVDRGAPGRGKALRFVLVNSWHRGSMTRSFQWACSSCSKHRHSQRHTTTFWIRRAVHDDDLEHPAQQYEEWCTTTILSTRLKNSATTFQAAIRKTRYKKSDRRSNATIDQDFIDDYPIIRVSPYWDPNNEA